MNHRHEFPPKSPLVFISHCDADREVAERICLAMDANGIPSWIAHRNIKPGDDIYKGFRSARVLRSGSIYLFRRDGKITVG